MERQHTFDTGALPHVVGLLVEEHEVLWMYTLVLSSTAPPVTTRL